MKIYVASSWRNDIQPGVVKALREAGHQVYDFRNPMPGSHGFAWSEIDANWRQWNTEAFINALEHPISNRGFELDFNAMKWADVCVMVMPCGRSAHIEAGWMQGAGKPTIIYLNGTHEPELMYKVFEKICTSMDEIIAHLSTIHLIQEVSLL